MPLILTSETFCAATGGTLRQTIEWNCPLFVSEATSLWKFQKHIPLQLSQSLLNANDMKTHTVVDTSRHARVLD